jgi:hypothetical protein
MLPDLFDPYQPFFSAALEAALLEGAARRFGHPPTRQELAAYRLLLYSCVKITLGHAERTATEQEKARHGAEFQTSKNGGLMGAGGHQPPIDD